MHAVDVVGHPLDVLLNTTAQVHWQAWALDDAGAAPNGPQLSSFLLGLPAEGVVGVSAVRECAVGNDLGVVVGVLLLAAVSRLEGSSPMVVMVEPPSCDLTGV